MVLKNLHPLRLACMSLGLFLLCPSARAQVQELDPTEDKYVSEKEKPYHEAWKEGRYAFPGKPRDMWQAGLGFGNFMVAGDVRPQFGWGASAFVRKSLGYVTSIRAEYMFGQASGLNHTPYFDGAHPEPAPFAASGAPALYSGDDPFYANYRIGAYHSFSVQGVFNLNNIRFHRKTNKWSINMIAGLGANLYQTRYNALDANGNAYDFRRVADDLDPSIRADRQSIRDNVRSIINDEYETVAEQNRRNGIIIGKDDKAMSFNPYLMLGFGVEYLVTPRLSIGLEHHVILSADDYLDGYVRQRNGARSSGVDIPHYTSVRIAFNIGSKEKRVPPLWFVNPMSHPNKDIAELKKKLDDDWFKDDDNDGVPNKIDEEPDTEPDAIVDTKGRTKDSDSDGIPDHLDKEPFSPPGYPTDEDGVAQVPPRLTEEDVVRIGDDRYELKGAKKGSGTLNEWFLPMIHYDMNSYNLSSEAYPTLHHIARVMKAYPEMKIVVFGHTDTRASEEYNDMLSYQRAMAAIDYLVNSYGVERERLVLQYDGKRSALVESVRGESDHYMNRRVEFFVAQPDDKEIEKPQGDGGANRKWKY